MQTNSEKCLKIDLIKVCFWIFQIYEMHVIVSNQFVYAQLFTFLNWVNKKILKVAYITSSCFIGTTKKEKS